MTWIRDALSGEINKADETGGNGSAEVRADETSRCSLAGDAVRADGCRTGEILSGRKAFPSGIGTIRQEILMISRLSVPQAPGL